MNPNPIDPQRNDYLSTLLHEGVHLLSSATGGAGQIFDDILYQATAKAAGDPVLCMPSYTHYSRANKRYFGTNCGP